MCWPLAVADHIAIWIDLEWLAEKQQMPEREWKVTEGVDERIVAAVCVDEAP